MKKKIILLSTLLAVATLFTSCEKRCHCYRYDGGHDFFTHEQLKNIDMSCVGMERYQMGLIYSLCEWDSKHY